MPLWLPCQFLCCRVSHFLLFVCAGGCQARWNAAEVILGGMRLGPRPGLYMTCLTPPAHPPHAGWSGLVWLQAGGKPGKAAGQEMIDPPCYCSWLVRGWCVQHHAGCGGGKGLRASFLSSGLLSCLGKESRDVCSLWQGRGTWSVSVLA